MAGKADGEPPEIQIVFEGDSDAPPTAAASDIEAAPPPSFHAVGSDPLGAVAASVADTVAEIRRHREEVRATEQATNQAARHDLAMERLAQVVQATSVPLEAVLLLLRTSVPRAEHLELTDREPDVRDGVAVFNARLKQRRPPMARRVELRVYPTTSGNLTVLELLPTRAWWGQTRRYLEAGVPAITDLTDRLEAAAAEAL